MVHVIRERQAQPEQRKRNLKLQRRRDGPGRRMLSRKKPPIVCCDRVEYILDYQDGSIPTPGREVMSLQLLSPNRVRKTNPATGVTTWYESREVSCAGGRDRNKRNAEEHELLYVDDGEVDGHVCVFRDGIQHSTVLTPLKATAKHVACSVERGRRHWKIENQRLNAEKNHGDFPGHMCSKDLPAAKNRHCLMRTGHMIP